MNRKRPVIILALITAASLLGDSMLYYLLAGSTMRLEAMKIVATSSGFTTVYFAWASLLGCLLVLFLLTGMGFALLLLVSHAEATPNVSLKWSISGLFIGAATVAGILQAIRWALVP